MLEFTNVSCRKKEKTNTKTVKQTTKINSKCASGWNCTLCIK